MHTGNRLKNEVKVEIRPAEPTDVPAMYELICELASYEKAPHEVKTTIESMLADGFGPDPVYFAKVAEVAGRVVATAVFHFKYSTWKGKSLYLDDIIVTETYRGQGIGSRLFEAVIEFARAHNCKRVYWQVLDWNTPAINFYKKYPVQMDDAWINCSLDII